MNRRKTYISAILFLLIAIVLTFLLAIIAVQIPIIKKIDPIGQLPILSPALAAFLMIMLNKKASIKDLNFRKINKHVVYIILAYILFKLIETFIQYLFGNISLNIGENKCFLYSGNQIEFNQYIFKASILTIFFAGFGEEIGWRGFLFNKLKHLPYLEMTLTLNIIWAFWHLPMFIIKNGMGHDNLLISFSLFIIISIEFGILLNYIRLKTNSVFGAVLLHPVANISGWIVFGLFQVNNEFWTQHPNIISILIILPFSIYYYRKGRELYETSMAK